MFDLFIFDLDGTILDTIDDIHNSLIETLKYFNLPTFSIETTKNFIGDGFKMLVKRAIGDIPFEEKYEEKFREIYSSNQTKKTKPFTGIKSILVDLKKQSKKVIVLSNKAFSNTDFLVKYFSLNKYLDNWYGADSFPEKKPSPLPIKMILSQYNIPNSKAIIIGDNYTDIESGSNANIKTCFCKYGYGKLSSVKPDFVVNSLMEFRSIFLEGINE